MPAGHLLLAVLVFGFASRADTIQPREAPSYASTSIVNAADNQPGPLAPNAIATIYGTGLAYTTAALSSSDISGGLLPTVLPGTGARVLVGGLAAGIYFVSPNQINFLVPNGFIPGPTVVQVVLDGLAGPSIPIQIAASSPAFFQADPQTIIATHPDGTLVTPASPAQAGAFIVLYATGLGQTAPPLNNLQVPLKALAIKQLATLQITIAGAPIDPSLIAYAGVCPGFAGLYQINLQLPAVIGQNPEVRISLAGQMSPPGLILPASPANTFDTSSPTPVY